jgi:histone deacetylase 6
MASNHRPVREYISIDDSDDEQPPAARPTVAASTAQTAQPSSLQSAARPATNAADVTSGLASASISGNVPTPREQLAASNGSINGSREEVTSRSPWMGGEASGATMLLDPADAVPTSIYSTEDAGQSSRQESHSTVPQARTDYDNRSTEPIRDLYSMPTPGLEPPLDLNTGPFAQGLPQQPLHSTRRWESDEEGQGSSGAKEENVQKFRSGLVYSSVMMLHAVPSYLDESEEGKDIEAHPERPKRISSIFDTLKKAGCVARMKRIPIRDVKMEEVMLIHQRGMWEGVQRTAFFTTNSLAAQTQLLEKSSSLYINEHSARCARLSCGGVIEMCAAVAEGKVRNGFALVRPPGHHAEPDRSMGFCFYNNVAVAARLMQEKYPDKCRKILILDWDVHHGNGTQSAFYESEDVLFISLHRYEDGEFFPGGKAGHHDQVGAGKGLGKNVNIPWPDKGMTDADYLAAFQRIVMPIATEFAPDFVIISAGFDAAEGDLLGECHVSPTGYAQMTYDLASLANGKLVVALEGGYNLDAIARSALSVTQVLLGETPPPGPAGANPSYLASDTLKEVEKVQARHWKSIRRPAYDMTDEEASNLERIGLAQMFALYRNYSLAERYDLDALPTTLGSRGDEDDMFTGQILCSSKLFDDTFDTLVIFAHDCGNLRLEDHGVDIDVQEELGYFVDGSSKVIDWANTHKAALIDVNLHNEIPTTPRAPVSSTSRKRNPVQLKSKNRLEEAKKLLLYAWDNAAVMVLSVKPEMKVILIGLGTATEAILHLIEQRNVEACVAGVIQLPAYSTIPTIAKSTSEKKMWYYKHSRVFLPKEHAYYTLDAQAKAGKRLGKIIRSSELISSMTRTMLMCPFTSGRREQSYSSPGRRIPGNRILHQRMSSCLICMLNFHSLYRIHINHHCSRY